MFIGCPFGLKTVTSIFQRVMSRLFENCKFVQVYVDILIHSSYFNSHLEHLDYVLNTLTKANLTINEKKSRFGFLKIKVKVRGHSLFLQLQLLRKPFLTPLLIQLIILINLLNLLLKPNC